MSCIVGSGIGGATAGRRPRRQRRARHHPRARRAAAGRARGPRRARDLRGPALPAEGTWRDGQGADSTPGNYYYVGGNSKFYGAVMLRYRERDFAPIEHEGGIYARLADRLCRAGALVRPGRTAVSGPRRGWARTRPSRRTQPYPSRARAGRAGHRRGPRAAGGAGPASVLATAGDRHRPLAAARATPWDAFPDTRSGKLDAETAPLAAALRSPDVTLATGAKVERLLPAPDGQRIEGVEYVKGGERRALRAGTVVLVRRRGELAALLLPPLRRLANRSGIVGRYFMNHNCTAMLAVDPRVATTRSIRRPLGSTTSTSTTARAARRSATSSCSARSPAPILQANRRWAPEFALSWLARHSCRLVSDERGPARSRKPGPRRWRDHRARLAPVQHGRPTNASSPACARLFQAAGYPIVLARAFDRRTPSHQCGTVRFGTDPGDLARSTLFCRAHDHPEPVRGRRLVPADLGRGQSGAHHRRAGAARRRPSGPAAVSARRDPAHA